MSAPEGSGARTSPGLFDSLRSFWGVILAILYTRFDLLTAELEDEATRAIQLIVVSLASLMCAGMAVFFLMFLLIASFWDTPYRLLILGIVFGIQLLAAAIFFFVARNMVLNRPKFLAQTLIELRRDVDSLRAAAQVKKSEEAK